jgi:hypothetical protein
MWTRLLKIADIHVVQERLTLHRIFSDQSNESGARPDRRARMWLEWYLQKKHYAGMPLADILEAFPESERWVTPKGANSGYLLAMFAIQIGGCPGTRLFGVEHLYQLMNDAEQRAEIESIHGFTYLDFIALTGQEDFFNPAAVEPVAPKPIVTSPLRRFAGKVVRKLRAL